MSGILLPAALSQLLPVRGGERAEFRKTGTRGPSPFVITFVSGDLGKLLPFSDVLCSEEISVGLFSPQLSLKF